MPTRTLAAQANDAAATDLAARIVDATDFSTAYDATADALARAGIRIETLDHVFVEPIQPWAGNSMSPRQVLETTLEAMNRRYVDRISADDVGAILAGVGWPISADGGTPGEQWLGFLQAWLADAKADPSDPTYFAPLFAAEMIRRGDGVDLATAKAADVHFGLLEMIVLTGAFGRAENEASTSVTLAVAHPQDQPGGHLAADTPCNSVLERAGIPPNTGDPFGGKEPDFLKKGAISVINPLSSGAKNALKAIGFLQKIWRAAAFYFYSFVRVTNSDGRLHKPNEETPDEYSIFTAKTGVDPDAFKQWVKDQGGPNGVRELNDATRCAESLGMPTVSDVGDIANDAENWIIDWEVVEGMPKHAELAGPCGTGGTSQCNKFDRSSTLGMKLHGNGGSTAEANLWIKIKDEKKSVHDSPAAVEGSAPVTVRAKVDSSKMPTISPTNLTSPTGLIGPGLETILGFIQSAFKPSAKATLTVTYHELSDWTLLYIGPIGYNITGIKCGGTAGDWTFDGVRDDADFHSTFRYTVTIPEGQLEGTFDRTTIEVTPTSTTTIRSHDHATLLLMTDGTVKMTVAATNATATAVAAGGTVTLTLPIGAETFVWQPGAIGC